MRLQVFTGRTPAEAMMLVRDTLGDDAIILTSEHSDGDGTKITATVVDDERLLHAATEDVEPVDAFEIVADALDRHGVPARLAQKLEDATIGCHEDEPLALMSAAFDSVFTFRPLEQRPPRPLMLVGPPGAGKTVAAAKLAARALVRGGRPGLITTDTVRAGGVEQLESLCRLMRLELERAPGPRQLTQAIAAADPTCLTMIDTGGINPYAGSDLADLRELVAFAGAEPLLVMPGGIDVFDAIELAAAFTTIGVTRFIATRLDLVHRLGSLLAMADATGIAFCEASATPAVAGGLAPLSPLALAQIILTEDAQPELQPNPKRALP